jgi:NAD(P)-dependent dehydrogenase (short-subunit alcohol dehydrogenase family)
VSEPTAGQSLSGKVVAVTGAASGIGRACASLAVALGATAVLLDRRPEVKSAAGDLGEDAIGMPLDVGQPDQVVAVFDEVADRFGRLDGLINAAGAMRYRLVEEHSAEEVSQLVTTNLIGPILTCRAAIPLLRASGGGDIVNLGSEVTEQYLPYGAVYTAAKGGLTYFTERLGREVRPHGIRVCLVVVGPTRTGMAASITDAERTASREAIADSAYQRFCGFEPQDPMWVAEAAVYPMTRPAGQYVGVIHARSMR